MVIYNGRFPMIWLVTGRYCITVARCDDDVVSLSYTKDRIALTIIKITKIKKYIKRYKAINITQINESQPTTTALKDARTVINSRLDKITFVFMIGLLLAAIITGWLVGNNALYLFIYFLILVIFIIVSAILSFVWDKLTTSSSHLATVMQYLPVTNHIIGNLPLYITIIGFIGMIVSFAKPYSQNQY